MRHARRGGPGRREERPHASPSVSGLPTSEIACWLWPLYKFGPLRIPAPVKRLGSEGLNAIDPVVTRRWRAKSGEAETPIPPRRLRARVGNPDIREWLPGGERVARELEG